VTTTTTEPVRVVFFGSSSYSAQILELVLEQPNILIVAVVTSAPKGQSHNHQAETEVALVAQKHNLILYRPPKVSEIVEKLMSLQPSAGLLFAYGQILPKALLDLFPLGIVNIHPSLLPRYRGPSPIEATILNGDTKAGSSIMIIDADMDSGPLLAQESFDVDDTITKPELTDKLMNLSQSLLIPALTAYFNKTLLPTPQSTEGVSYCRLISKADGELQPTTESAQQIYRKIRAYAGWPGTTLQTQINHHLTQLKIHEAHITSGAADASPGELYQADRELILQCLEGALSLDLVQIPGKRTITGRDACNSLQIPKKSIG